jgi:hypothetical protein
MFRRNRYFERLRRALTDSRPLVSLLQARERGLVSFYRSSCTERTTGTPTCAPGHRQERQQMTVWLKQGLGLPRNLGRHSIPRLRRSQHRIHRLHGTQDVRRLKILGPWLTWQRSATFMLDGLVFLVDVSVRLAGLPHPAVPMKYHLTHHQCCTWLNGRRAFMPTDRASPQGQSRASEERVFLEAVDLKRQKSPLKTSTIPGPQTPDQHLLSSSLPA